ncbi:MAG: hypothetical protein ACI4JQ_07895, partial [Ruminococcus sp.]
MLFASSFSLPVTAEEVFEVQTDAVEFSVTETDMEIENEIEAAVVDAQEAEEENWLAVSYEVLSYYAARMAGLRPAVCEEDWLFYDVIPDRTINLEDAEYFLYLYSVLGSGVEFDGYIPSRNGVPSPLTTSVTTDTSTTTVPVITTETVQETTYTTTSAPATTSEDEMTIAATTAQKTTETSFVTTTTVKETTTSTSSVSTTTQKTTDTSSAFTTTAQKTTDTSSASTTTTQKTTNTSSASTTTTQKTTNTSSASTTTAQKTT